MTVLDSVLKAYQSPTRMVHAIGPLSALGGEAASLNVKRPLVVTDQGIVKAGLLEEALKPLRAAGLDPVPYDAINAPYLARLLSQDWGLHRTIQMNTERVRGAARELGVAADVVDQRLDQLWQLIDAQPKSLKWKLRNRVGDRVSWYELPEEVRQPYETA